MGRLKQAHYNQERRTLLFPSHSPPTPHLTKLPQELPFHPGACALSRTPPPITMQTALAGSALTRPTFAVAAASKRVRASRSAMVTRVRRGSPRGG